MESDGATSSDSSAAADTAPPPPTTPVHFVAIGDQGKGCASATDGQCVVAAAIEAKCKAAPCDFGLLLGDNIYPSGATSATDTVFQTVFEEPYKNLSFPFYVVLGNHDYGGNGLGNEFGKGQNEIDYTAHSTKWKLPANHYHQVFGNGALELFATDTNLAMYSKDAPQRPDLKSWIAASTATWKIALGHHPYLSNGTHGNAGCYDALVGQCILSIPPANGSGVKSFLDDVMCGKVDVYLSGHDHSRQWMKDTCQGTELIVSGGGASTTELPGKNDTHFAKAEIGFLYVTIDGKTLTAEFINGQGNVDFSRTLTKP
ncbi:MAG: metallophosphoesterase [Polyangiaceae bacterium]